VFRNIEKVVRLPTVWLQGLIIVCAYVGYKGIDNYSLFAVQAYGMDEVEGAKVTAISAWVRPVAAVGAGLLGDRITSSRVSALCFATMVASYLWFGLTEPVPSMSWVLYANVLVSCTAVFGLRGVYFALFEEGAVPMQTTGTAVGLVSVIGYTPDVFVALAGGWLLDRSPGVTGHQHFFLFLSAFAVLGLAASLGFRRTQPSSV
jgi:sugar phosphate permease